MAAEHKNTAKPVEGKSQMRTGFRRVIRNALIICGLLAVVGAPVVLAKACGGQGSAVEEDQESQLFATDPFELEPGLAIVQMTHQGEGDFVVNLLPAEEKEIDATPERLEFFGDQNGGSNTEAALSLADKTGSANISRAVGIPTAGKRIFDVKASGPWTIQVEQPHPSSAPKPTRFSGGDDAATPFFQLSSGSKEITLTNPVRGKLKVSLLDKDGNEVEHISGDETDRADQDQSSTISSTVDIPEDGIYHFDVEADSLWTNEINDVE